MDATLGQAGGEIVEYLRDLHSTAEREGQATWSTAHYAFKRYGYFEEILFSYTIIPIGDEDGITRGLYAASFETTRQAIWQRRLST